MALKQDPVERPRRFGEVEVERECDKESKLEVEGEVNSDNDSRGDKYVKDEVYVKIDNSVY